MRVARVLSNETCNYNCTFCNVRRPTERPDFVPSRAVLGRVARALGDGAEEVVLTGGEPGLRRDLAALVRISKRAGAKTVVLETNAALIDAKVAGELSAVGLSLARVHLPAWGEAFDRVVQEEGAFEAALRGLRALANAGIPLEASVPVVRANSGHVESIPDRVTEAKLPITAFVVMVPTDAPDESTLLPAAEAASEVAAFEAAARRTATTVRMDPGAFIPPCMFQTPGRVAHLYSLSRGGGKRVGYEHVDVCSDCAVSDRCPGVPGAILKREPNVRLKPIQEDRIRRRLSVISTVEAQIARELVTREICRRTNGTSVHMHTVRVNFHCNQSCHFCFVSTHLPPAREEKVREAILEAGSVGGILALSGGEPTLNPRLVEYVRLGKEAGACEIELQTNATRLGSADLTRSLAEAGLDVAFVSLHGSTADVSDAVTDAPGTFDKTVQGLDQVRAHGIRMRINFVFCETNRQDFPQFVKLVAERWPEALVSVSFVAPSTDMVPRDASLVPRYSDVLPSMAEGLRLARELKVGITGFESMCGLPLCLIPVGLEEYFNLPDIMEGIDGGEFIRPEPCTRCNLAGRCYGLRRGYAEMHGIGELRPVKATG